MAGAREVSVEGVADNVIVRRGGPLDVRFLRDMLHHAYYWRERSPEEGPGPVARYVKGWGRPGDTSVIAVSDGFSVGAAWYRLFTRTVPGYGFVDERTPELAIATVPSVRKRGVGAAMFDTLLERAAEEGHPAISLSIDKANEAAIRWYEKRGFRPLEEHALALTMRAELPVVVDPGP
jgi:ribosomal protein S18 acetylase RimI-like enzyme